jgi:uncharacterized repeat protein (TIGR03803 family)
MQWKFGSKVTVVLAALTVLPPVAGALAAGVSQAGGTGNVTVAVLYNFDGAELIYPAGPIVAQGRDGSLYSTTTSAGTYNDGVVFRITPNGKATVIQQLDTPYGSSGLTLGTDGNFYGTTFYGGYGKLFKVTPGGKMTILYDFSGQNFDAYPFAPPIQGSDGNSYGTARGDLNGNSGTVYKLTPSRRETTLFKFDRTDGAVPCDPLIQAADGSFYGTTQSGGASGRCEQYGCGTVFKVTPNGAFTLLHSFNVKDFDGYYPYAPVTEGNDSNLYGTVTRGGVYGYGIVYKITRTGKYTILHSFDITDGETPFTGVVLATDGNFYGTTEGGGTSDLGTIFKVTPSGEFSVIYNFDNTTGAYPSAGLLQHTDGKVYGFAGQGGTYNYGTFFSVDLGIGPFASLVPASGRIGKSIGILGQGFTGTTGVAFNGTAAAFKVVSDTYLTAVVPRGATTGFVMVQVPSGNLKSNKRFRVTSN